MQYFELAYLTTMMGKAADVAAGVKRFCEEAEQGQLAGVWFSDIGKLNQVIVLRTFDSAAELDQERQRTLEAADPFYATEWLIDLDLQRFAGFPFLPEVELGAVGPAYELRTYEMKHGGLPHVLHAWEQAVPERIQYSKLTAAMYSLDGVPRIVSIWPYASVDQRTQVRQQVVQEGVWPPKGGPQWLTHQMESIIMWPTAVSPLK